MRGSIKPNGSFPNGDTKNNMKEKKNTILVPVITPFTDGETIDYDALQRHVECVLGQGADGIYVCGSSAECFSLSEQERMKSLEAILEAAGGAFVVAHVGTFATGNSIRLARHAERVGADVISCMPPFGLSYSFEEIKSYYTDVMKSVELPMMAYNFPAATQTHFTLEQFLGLFAEEKMQYLKFSDVDFYMLEQVKSHTGAFIYSGKDENFLSGLAAGADGAIGLTFNFMVGKFKEIYRLFREGKAEEARTIQHSVNEMVRTVCRYGIIEATKYLVGLKGIGVGHARKPFARLTEEAKTHLRSMAEREGIL